MNEIIDVLRGPWGLLAQLLALGYVLSAFVLYGLRRRFFHPDVINVLGAAVGGVVWALIEAWSIARTGSPMDAVASLGTVLALPTVSATMGRAYWLIVARRDERRRASLTKWEYKTHASALALAGLGFVGGIVVWPAQTLLLGVVAGAAWFSLRGEREWHVRLGINRWRGNGGEVPGAVVRTNRGARKGRLELDLETLSRITAAAAGVDGVLAVGEPMIELAAKGGWCARLSVTAAGSLAAAGETPLPTARQVHTACAKAVADAVPELAEIVIHPLQE